MSTPRALRLNADDNLVIAVDEIKVGDEPANARKASERIPRGHKMATAPIETGEPIRKFGQIIGFASKPIAPGEWMHEHNCVMHDFARDYHFCEDARPRRSCRVEQQATFEGYRRANGKTGTRNYLGILTSVNCSATVARLIAREVERSGILEDYPNVDGVIRARARHRLRHGRQGRRLRRAEAHPMGLCRQSQHGRRHHGRARLRSVPDRAHEGGIRHRRERAVPVDDDPGDRRHAQDRRGRASRGSRRCCRSSTRRGARRGRRAN